MNSFIRWTWLLGFALIAPITLPAGGAVNTAQTMYLRKSSDSSVIAGDNCLLKTSPLQNAPLLKKVDYGTSLRLLRKWNSSDGDIWFQVQISSAQIFSESKDIRRGWINV